MATAFVVAWQGYDYGDANHAVQIPLQRAADEPGLFPRDLLRVSATGYATFFFRGLSLLERLSGDAEAVYFALYVVGHVAVLAAVFALGRLLFCSRLAAQLACLLYLARPPALAGETSYFTQLTHAHVATALLLWAIWLHLRGRSRWAMTLVGLAANIHVLYALHVAALLGLDLVLRRREVGLRGIAVGLGLFLLWGAPTLAWLASSSMPVPADRVGEWLEIMRERSPQHTFPLSLPAGIYGGYALFLGLAGTIGAWPRQPGAGRSLCNLLAGVILLCTLGFVFSELVPVPIVIRGQLLRSTKWLTLLALPVLGQGLTQAWRWGGLAPAALVGAVGGIAIGQPALLAPTLLLLLVVAARRGLAVGRLGTGCVALVLGASSGVAELPPDLNLGALAGLLGTLVTSPILVGLVCLALLLLRATPDGRRPVPHQVWSVLAVLVALGLMTLTEVRARAARRAEPWYQVQRWARDHTPATALFLTPPYRQGFRVFSERSVVGEWKDGTQQFFSMAFGFEWRRRMRDLRAPGRAYDRLDASALLELGRKYGAEFAVTHAARALSLPLLFRNEEWAVYSLAGRT